MNSSSHCHHASGDHIWALVLAGGDGNRLKPLTTTLDGVAVPKQYCSLHGEVTLLEDALHRAETITSKQRICTVVAAQHRQWWQHALAEYVSDHTVVQPHNCGTAIGIMLPLLHILRRDPQAQVVLLPSDHHVHEEPILADSLLRATERLNTDAADKVIILGLEPDEADCELGYVLPGKHLGDGVSSVASFVEKPSLIRAQQLLTQGALWNTFIVAAKAKTLLQLFARRCQGILTELQAIVDGEHEPYLRSLLLNGLYARLPSLDFSRDILQGVESFLEVLSVPACGWSDLGTPRRIRQVLHRWPYEMKPALRSGSAIPVTLAAQAGFIINKSHSYSSQLSHAREA